MNVMSEYAWLGKLVADFGGMTLAVVLMYSLINKWAALFLASQASQADGTFWKRVETAKG